MNESCKLQLLQVKYEALNLQISEEDASEC